MRHRFHSICPYFAMFPESFVETWVERLTKPGDYVLDPFCGRGTTPFQALLMDRKGIGSDVNPVAFCLTKAKVDAPSLAQARRRLTILKQGYQHGEWKKSGHDLPEFFRWAFETRTLSEVLYLRKALD
jgi:adenine-specific DNA methylase